MVWLQALAGVFAMCSQVRHFTLIVSLFIQVNNGYCQLYADRGRGRNPGMDWHPIYKGAEIQWIRISSHVLIYMYCMEKF